MARSDLLVSLVRAGAAGDRDLLKSTAEALMADERAKNHHLLADRLQRALSTVAVTPPLTPSASPLSSIYGREAIIEVHPQTRFDDLLLTLPVRENGRQLVEEHIRADVLRAHGLEAGWRDVFDLLRDLRPWGPSDRIQEPDVDFLQEAIADHPADYQLKLEIELIFRRDPAVARSAEDEVQSAVAAHGGRILSRSRIAGIAYHALLAELPIAAVRQVIHHTPGSLSLLDPIMHIRPQSVATGIDIADSLPSDVAQTASTGEPILALLDGVPIGAQAKGLSAARVLFHGKRQLEQETRR